MKKHDCIKVNLPSLAKDPAFVEWLNSEGRAIATWHHKAPGKAIGEYSDVFVWVAPAEAGCEAEDRAGSDSDMPIEAWAKIASFVPPQNGALVWITFLNDKEDLPE